MKNTTAPVRIVNAAKHNRREQGRLLGFRVIGNRCDIWTWTRESALVIKAKVAASELGYMDVGVEDYF